MGPTAYHDSSCTQVKADFKHCSIIIPQTEQECIDLYEIYKSVSKKPVQYWEYEQRRCDV